MHCLLASRMFRSSERVGDSREVLEVSRRLVKGYDSIHLEQLE